jgi:hypothetical protein
MTIITIHVSTESIRFELDLYSILAIQNEISET